MEVYFYQNCSPLTILVACVLPCSVFPLLCIVFLDISPLRWCMLYVTRIPRHKNPDHNLYMTIHCNLDTQIDSAFQPALSWQFDHKHCNKMRPFCAAKFGLPVYKEVPRGSLAVHAHKSTLQGVQLVQYIAYILFTRSTADPFIGAGKQQSSSSWTPRLPYQSLGNKIFSTEHGISIPSSNMKESRNWFLQFEISRTEKR